VSPTQKRVAIYARVSTLDQNPALQLGELREFAHRRGFLIQAEYVDHVTGSFERRRKGDQEYQRLLTDAQGRAFDCVLVWKFDRFARSLHALVNALELFRSLDIDFISATQNVDTTTPMGRLFFQMIGAFAEFERSLIADRTRAGIQNARKHGVVFGRPRSIALEAQVRELHGEGKSLRQIAATVKRSPAGVFKILKRDQRSPGAPVS
jgi:DNA invertase Pin-like site-specific DNA recombinase